MQVKPTLDFTAIEPTKPALKRFVIMLRQVYQNLTEAINGSLGFGDGSKSDNISGTWINVVAPAAPNTDFTVAHELNRLPVGYWIMQKDRVCDVYTGSVTATKTQLTLRASVASAVLRLFVICALLFCGSLVQAQTTNLTIQVTDAGGQSWNVGSWQATLITPPGINPFGPPFFLVGTTTPVPGQNQSGLLSGTGSATMTLTQNIGILPALSQWRFQVCSAATAVNNCFVQFATVTAVTTLTITPPTLIVNATPITLAYADSEVSAGRGALYFNLITGLTRQCATATGTVCTLWQSFGGGGGGATLQTNGVTNTTQNILNLINGTNIGITADAFGGVTIANTAPLQATCPPSGGQGTVQAANGTGGCQATGLVETSGVLTNNDENIVCGPNPFRDIRCDGAIPLNTSTTPYAPGITTTCTASNNVVTVPNGSLFTKLGGVVLYGCGASQSMPTPSAPTVTCVLDAAAPGTNYTVPCAAGGSENTCYVYAAMDKGLGTTAKSPEACITGQTRGEITVAITSCQRSLFTLVTCVTAPHTLAVGARIDIAGTTLDSEYAGTHFVTTVTDNTHFSFQWQRDSRMGASTVLATGGNVKYRQANHIALGTPVAGAYQHGVYRGATNAETFFDVSTIVNASLNLDSSYMTVDDFGTTYTTVPNVPTGVWPNTPPATATPDALVTTITNISGNNLTLAVAPSQTPGVATSIVADNTPNILATYNNASTNHSMVYWPAIASSNKWATNSILDLSSPSLSNVGTSISGPPFFGETIITGGKFNCDLSPSSLVYPQFGLHEYTPVYINAKPGINAVKGEWKGCAFTPQGTNANSMFIAQGAIPAVQLVDDAWIGSSSGSDYQTVPLYLFTQGNAGNQAAGVNIVNNNFSGQPNGATPYLISKNFGEVNIDGFMGTQRGMFFSTCPSCTGTQVNIKNKYEIQSEIMPIIMTKGTVALSVDGIIEDTGCQPIITNVGTGAVTIAIGPGGITVPGCSIPQITGYPSITSITGSSNPDFQQGINLNYSGQITGILYDGILNSTQAVQDRNTHEAIGPNYATYTTTAPPAAPTCSVATAGPPFTFAGTFFFSYAPVYADNGIARPSPTTASSCTSDGLTQQITVTIPSQVSGASGYNFYRTGAATPFGGGFQIATSTNSCGTPGSPGATLATIVTSNCGTSSSPLNGSGPAGIVNDHFWTTFVDAVEINPPANPPTGIERWFPNLVTHQFSCLTSSGSSCAASGGAVAPPPLSVQFNNSGSAGGIPVPTTPSGVSQSLTSTPSGGVGVVGAFHLSGVVPRVTACPGNIDTVLAKDRTGLVEWNDASACAVNLPQAGSGTGTDNDFTNNFVFLGCNIGVGVATITPTSSSLTVINNGVITTPANLPLSKGQCAFFYSDNTNYTALQVTSSGLSQVQTNTVNNTSQTLLNLTNSAATNGITLTVTNTSGGIVQLGYTGTLNNAGLTNSATTVNGQTCTLGSTCTIPPGTITIANAGTTGTTVNTLTKLTGAPSTAVITATTDTGGVVGITTSGAGITGSAVIQLLGSVLCVFDGATIANDYVQISSTTVGNCHDTNSALYPTSGQVIGRVLTTNGAAGTYTIDLFPSEIKAGGGVIGYGTGAGAVNVMTVTTVPAITTNVAGTVIEVLPNLANTTTNPTLNVGGSGALTIVKGWNQQALLAGDYNTSTNAFFLSDGTHWQLLNPLAGGVYQTSVTAGSASCTTFGTAGGLCAAEGTTPTNVSGTAFLYPDGTAHEFLASTNGSNAQGMMVRVQPVAVNQTAKTAAITTATLCNNVAGACNVVGQYHVHWNFWGSGTACSSVTAGSVQLQLTWTDENAVVHSVIAMPMWDQKAGTFGTNFNFNTALATEGASGDYTISTNGSIIQYATTYTACTTGTGTYNLRASVTRLQ